MSTNERAPASRFVAAVAVALALHGLVLVVLAYSISFQLPAPESTEPRIVAVAQRPVPPPPDVSELGDVDAVTALPRFRPRSPATISVARHRQYGDPALAIWKHLCNRDQTLSVATARDCPPNFGQVDLGAFDPLNRTGDVGALFGAGTATMSLEEAAVARGWIKMPPPKGQSGLANRTDKSHADPAADRFGPMPWDVGSSKGATPTWSKDRPEAVPDLR